MAQKATIFKFDLSISDLDNNIYQDFQLTVARHPSENDMRMMLRIIAFMLNASDTLEFTKGLSDLDEPDLWQKNLHDEIELWIELGQPSETRIKKGCNQSKLMHIYAYDNNSLQQWWTKEQSKLNTRNNLTVTTIDEDVGQQLVALLERHNQIQCTISEGELWLTVSDESLSLTPKSLKAISS